MKPVNVYKRLMAFIYDSLCVLGLLFIAAAIMVAINGGAIEAEKWWFQVYLFSLVYLYFAFSWINGRQTIGMRAWKIGICRQDQQPLTLRDTFIRFALAIPSILFVGLGFIFAWHDRWSNTQLYLIERNKNSDNKPKHNIGPNAPNNGGK